MGDKNELARRIAVMQGFHDGKKLQRRDRREGGKWFQETGPVWDWYSSDYRIAPEPREWMVWINPLSNTHGIRSLAEDEIFARAPNCEYIRVREVLPPEDGK